MTTSEEYFGLGIFSIPLDLRYSYEIRVRRELLKIDCYGRVQDFGERFYKFLLFFFSLEVFYARDNILQ